MKKANYFSNIFNQSSLKKKRIFWGCVFILPCAAFILIFRLYPFIHSFYYSFFDYHLLFPDAAVFNGLSNYYFAFFQDGQFFNSVWITFIFAVLKIILQLIPAFLIALFLLNRGKLTGPLRTAILTPTVTSFVVVSVIWSILLNPHVGLFNSILSMFGIPRQGFLINPNQALYSLLAMTIWKDMGFAVIVFLAGLMDIPKSLYEQASIDGASYFQKVVKITIPLMKRTFLFLSTMMIIWSFKVFTPIYLTTEGGPRRSTNHLVYYIFENAFTYQDMGYALALTVILVVLVSAISGVNIKLFSERQN